MALFQRRAREVGPLPKDELPRPSGEAFGQASGQAILPGGDAVVDTSRGLVDWGHGSRIAALGPDGDVILLDPAEASFLRVLKRPCPPLSIGERLRQVGWDDEGLAEAAAMYGRLEARGLIRSLGDIVEGARRVEGDADADASGPGIACLAIPTRDRPETLARALGAWSAALEAQAEGGAMPDLVVADDSVRDPGATRRVVEAHSHGHRGKVRLLDAASRRDLAKALSPAGGPSVDFALGLDSGMRGLGQYGAARNFALLANAGRTLAMADDDILPRFALHPAAAAGLALCARPDPSTIRPFADRAGLEEWARPARGSALDPHLAYLGRGVRSLLFTQHTLDLGQADATTLELAFRGGARAAQARVAAITFGTWGDSGIPTNRYLLALRDAVEAGGGGVYEAGAYEAALAQRTIFRGPLCATLGGKSFMGGHISLDARGLLPPFSPAGRDEDGLWGFCLGLLEPSLMIAYPAEAVLHDPPFARESRREEALRWDLWLNEALRVLLAVLSGGKEVGADAYVTLGRRLASLARGPRLAFRRALAEASTNSMAARVGLLEQALSRHGGEPAAWAKDVESAIGLLTARLGEPRFWLPREFDGVDRGEAEDALAGYVARFGGLLEAWPAIFAAAVEASPAILDQAALPR